MLVWNDPLSTPLPRFIPPRHRYDRSIRAERTAETTNERGRFDDESRWYSVIITVARDSARKTVVRREGRPSNGRELGSARPAGSHR